VDHAVLLGQRGRGAAAQRRVAARAMRVVRVARLVGSCGTAPGNCIVASTSPVSRTVPGSSATSSKGGGLARHPGTGVVRRDRPIQLHIV